MNESLVYRNPWFYEAAMFVLYGRHYSSRYQAVAAEIPEGSRVLDLGCGPGVLYQHYLRRKSVDYTGLDINSRFVARVGRLGGRGIVWDLNDDRALPAADFVVMQASLYQFLPDAAPVVRRMIAAARRGVVIAEPIRNLATSRIPLVAALAQQHTDPGLGAPPRRFTEPDLDAFMGSFPVQSLRSFLIPGGREKVFILEPLAPAATPVALSSGCGPDVAEPSSGRATG